MKRAIDVSVWQGAVDFNRIKNAGIDMVVVKSSQGRYLSGEGAPFADPRYHENMRRAAAADLGLSIYHFFCAINAAEARNEARFCLDLAGSYRQHILYIFCDVENYSNRSLMGQSRATLTENVRVFCDTIRAGGFEPGIYTNRDHLLHVLDADSLHVPVWEAAYLPKNPWTSKNQIMWQYTSSGTVDGINGAVDRSECYFDPARLSVTALYRRGILTNAQYWLANLNTVKYLGALFEKAEKKIGGSNTTYFDADAAIDRLKVIGVINTPDYWKKQVKAGKLKYLDSLLCKLASV